MSDNLKLQPFSTRFTSHGCAIELAVQLAAFGYEDDSGAEASQVASLAANQDSASASQTGAEVRFIGRVRGLEAIDGQEPRRLKYLELEHYPAMTEAALRGICEQAAARWETIAMRVLHRVGQMAVGEPIVLVEVCAEHRQSAFECSQFIMDYLKVEAPFWKKAVYDDGSSHWIEQRRRDRDAQGRWASK